MQNKHVNYILITIVFTIKYTDDKQQLPTFQTRIYSHEIHISCWIHTAIYIIKPLLANQTNRWKYFYSFYNE